MIHDEEGGGGGDDDDDDEDDDDDDDDDDHILVEGLVINLHIHQAFLRSCSLSKVNRVATIPTAQCHHFPPPPVPPFPPCVPLGCFHPFSFMPRCTNILTSVEQLTDQWINDQHPEH